jgi:membrane fusion protein, copper/silver efflux system
VQGIDGERLRIDTDAIASLAMGAMTMEFACPATVPTAGIRTGQRIRFTFFRNAAGDFEIRQIAAVPDAPHERKDGTP